MSPPAAPSMRGKVCLVTGANAGIGFHTALALSRQGARVVLACRDRAKGESALADIRRLSGSAEAELLPLDLASFASVRAAALEFHRRHDRLHVLVNNAGLYRRQRQSTADGFELTFQSNHLGHFLLTHLLLDLLKASAPARIVNVSSNAHRSGMMRWDDLQAEKSYDGMAVYAQSKLANILFTYELARRLKGTRVTANCLHPGVIASEFFRDMPWLVRGPLSLVLTSPEKGARPSIRAASDPGLDSVTGKYFYKSVEGDSIPESHDAAAALRLWDLSERACGLTPR